MLGIFSGSLGQTIQFEHLEERGILRFWVCRTSTTNQVRGIAPTIYVHVSHSIPGELEATFMTSVCRSSNLQALVDTCRLPEQAGPLLTAYGSVVSEDHRGTRLADQDHHPPTKPPRSEVLDDESYQLLLQMLNKKFRTTGYTSGRGQVFSVTRSVRRLEKVSIRGVVYACEKSLPRDSNVLFRRLGGSSSRVGRIWSIFRLQHPTPDVPATEATYILVREYLPFPDEAMQYQYKQFGFAGGFLCHSERWSRFHIVELTDIISHFAKTTLRDGDGSIMHVLPLNKVKTCSLSSLPANCALDDEILHPPFCCCVVVVARQYTMLIVRIKRTNDRRHADIHKSLDSSGVSG